MPLTDHERALWDKYYQPIKDEMGMTPDYMPREVVGKNGLLERIKTGVKQAPGVGLLRTRTPSMKHRIYKAAIDQNGRRLVVAAERQGPGTFKLTAFNEKRATPLGTVRLKSNAQQMEKELAPVERRTSTLETERRILKRNKGTTEAAKTRIANIDKELNALENKRREIQGKYSAESLNDKSFVDRHGNKYQIKEATAKEIERHTNTTYHKNALGALATEFVTRRQARRQADYLEALKASPEFAAVAVKGAAPKGWKPASLPQFQGYSFEPHVAEVLNNFARRQSHSDLLDNPMLSAANNLLTHAMFSILSVWHDFNLADIWITSRGLSGSATPRGLVRLFKTAGPAWREVMSLGDKYQRLYAAGAPFKRISALHSVDDPTYAELLNSIATEIETKPELHPIAAALGYVPGKLVSVIRWWAHHQQTSMWTFNDFLSMQMIMEFQRGGLSEAEAVNRTFETLPSYRLPEGINITNLLAHHNVSWFFRYHFGLFRAYGKMMGRLVGLHSSAADRARAADQLAMVGIMTMVVYPILDAVAQEWSGNEDAKVERFGLSAVPYKLYEFSTGQKALKNLLLGIISPARASEEAMEQFFNRDFYTGDAIAPAYDTAAENAIDRLKHAAGAFIPFETARRAPSFGAGIAAQFGVKIPKDRQTREFEYRQREREERRRAREYYLTHPR